MKFKIIWIENLIIDQDNLDNFLGTLPNPKITGIDCFGGTEIECFDTFEAEDIEGAKNTIKLNYSEVEQFTVLEVTEELIFTEEDM